MTSATINRMSEARSYEFANETAKRKARATARRLGLKPMSGESLASEHELGLRGEASDFDRFEAQVQGARRVN